MTEREQILETCNAMASLADRRDWDGLGDVFADVVVLDYTSLNGGEPASVERAHLISGWATLLGSFAATQHLVGNHLISTDGKQARCRATFQATHVYPSTMGEPIWTLGGDYQFELRRDPDRWRITAVTMTAKWSSGNQHVLALASRAGTEGTES